MLIALGALVEFSSKEKEGSHFQDHGMECSVYDKGIIVITHFRGTKE